MLTGQKAVEDKRMVQSLMRELILDNERGILDRKGPEFRLLSDFAVKNLSYVIWSNQFTCDRSYAVTHKSVNCYSLIHMLEGSLEVLASGKKYIVKEGEAILIDFSKDHSYRCISDTAKKWEIIMNGDLVRAYYEMIDESWGTKFQVEGRVAIALKKLREAVETDSVQDHRLAWMIQKLFCEIIEKNTSGLSPQIIRAIQYMYDNYDKDIHVEDIAEVVSFSRSYFSKVFTKETGVTPKEFLLNVRINVAQEILADQKEVSMIDIADRCGFADASHFSRMFKQKTGRSPREYRGKKVLSHY